MPYPPKDSASRLWLCIGKGTELHVHDSASITTENLRPESPQESWRPGPFSWNTPTGAHRYPTDGTNPRKPRLHKRLLRIRWIRSQLVGVVGRKKLCTNIIPPLETARLGNHTPYNGASLIYESGRFTWPTCTKNPSGSPLPSLSKPVF